MVEADKTQKESKFELSSLGLNPGQLEAVKATEGPVLVLAGPGAGKTKTLVDRIVHLVANKGVEPNAILVSTFTEKAASELLSRVSNRLDDFGIRANLGEMYIGTLHSIFLRILEENAEHTDLRRNFAILSPFEQSYTIFSKLKELTEGVGTDFLQLSSTASTWEKSEYLSSIVNHVTEEMLSPQELYSMGGEHLSALATVYERYLALLHEENVLEFSLLQAKCLDLLTYKPKVLEKLTSQIQYLMVDEYQDTNRIQEKILLLLAGERKNLFVVGDDDQALYRFRGATIENILRFEKNFEPGVCKKIVVSTNYRSHPEIIEFYNTYMDEADWEDGDKSFRYEKDIRPRDGAFPNYKAVLRLGTEVDKETSKEDALFPYFQEVLSFIRRLQEEGKVSDLNQIAFLFRSVKNNRVLALARFLEENDIPVFSPRSALFFNRKEVRLVIGAVVFLFPDLMTHLKGNGKYELSIWKYYDECKRLFANELRSDMEKHSDLLKWVQARAKSHLTMTKALNYGLTGLIYKLLEYPLFAEYLDVDLHGTAQSQRAAYNMALVTEIFHRFEAFHNVAVIGPKNLGWVLRNFFNFYLRFVHNGGIEEYEDFDEVTPRGCVSFMTIHQSKGLEFPVVVCGSLNVVPRKERDLLKQLVDETVGHVPYEPPALVKHFDFRRLFYTAFSRAQNLLVLTAMEKDGRGREPSKYLIDAYLSATPWRDEDANLPALELAEVKTSDIKKEYSYTNHVLIYENCPLQYKFYKEMGFAEATVGGAIGGTLLHYTIEDMHRTVLDGKPGEVTEGNVEDWFHKNYRTLVKTQHGYLAPSTQKALLEQVQNYRKRQKGKWDQVVDAEVDVSLLKKEYILHGTIDLIRGEKGTVEIVDFKSGKKPDMNSAWGRKMLRQYQRQLEIYSHLVEERTGHTVSGMKLYYAGEVDSNPYIPFGREEVDIEKTIAQVDEVMKNIEAKNFTQTNEAKCKRLCGNCDFRYHCSPGEHGDIS